MVSYAMFAKGEGVLIPRLLSVLTSSGVIVLLTSIEESSPCEEELSDATTDVESIVRTFVGLSQKRKHHPSSSKTASDAKNTVEATTSEEEQPATNQDVIDVDALDPNTEGKARVSKPLVPKKPKKMRLGDHINLVASTQVTQGNMSYDDAFLLCSL